MLTMAGQENQRKQERPGEAIGLHASDMVVKLKQSDRVCEE